jgi:hypothetical protein
MKHGPHATSRRLRGSLCTHCRLLQKKGVQHRGIEHWTQKGIERHNASHARIKGNIYPVNNESVRQPALNFLPQPCRNLKSQGAAMLLARRPPVLS